MDEKFWGKGMTAYGCNVSPREMAEAVRKWSPFFGYQHLARCVEREQPGVAVSPDAACRIADRMVQKMRKAGLIRHIGGGKWRFGDEVC